HLPAEEGDTLAAVLLDHDPLLAVVHAQRKLRAALLNELHAQKACAETRPVLQRPCVNADISERLDVHGPPPKGHAQAHREYGLAHVDWQFAAVASVPDWRLTQPRRWLGLHAPRSDNRPRPARRLCGAGCQPLRAPSRWLQARP